MKNKSLIIILVIILALGAFLVWSRTGDRNSIGEIDGDQVMCTQEAMLCPDGSYVGRTGPNCEFAACPGSSEPVFEDGTLPPDRGNTQSENISIEGTAEGDLDQDMVGGTGAGGKGEGGAAVCTMDAKMCPDGSSVGRTGPNCEFAACPGN